MEKVSKDCSPKSSSLDSSLICSSPHSFFRQVHIWAPTQPVSLHLGQAGCSSRASAPQPFWRSRWVRSAWRDRLWSLMTWMEGAGSRPSRRDEAMIWYTVPFSSLSISRSRGSWA